MKFVGPLTSGIAGCNCIFFKKRMPSPPSDGEILNKSEKKTTSIVAFCSQTVLVQSMFETLKEPFL